METRKICNRAILTALALGVFLSASAAAAQVRLNHLKSWANEYPIDNASKPHRNFFQLREIREPLLKLLGKPGFDRLMESFGLVQPIDLISGYLVLEGAANLHVSPVEEHAVLAVRLSDGTMHVAFARDGKVEWFSSRGKHTQLRRDIRNRIQQYAN
jgi:hypothetical protein